MELTELFQKAILEFDRRVRVVGQGQWHDPTPCSEWDVHDLTNHVVNELRWVTPLTEGKTIAEVGDRLDGDLLGDDPRAAANEAIREANSAVQEPGVMERTVHISFGDVPGEEYISQVTADVAIHSWDLARAIGADDTLEPGLVEFAYDFLEPQVQQWRAGGAFGPAVNVPDDADLQTKLLGMVGRQP
jgi:uncharacterized protein (TIGR03086 family)